ncbi:MAG: phosphohydrolase [Bacteroidetes bacterium GWF2_43_63]|nr:MAG: phosphohydrolase [Bacteroidetes bacterium GWE2_42_42]OFY54177.1 MAG: phosphohydrolase [Bacteroidetes bacterium GWF2_43_63]HBG70814.1 phosphohydrolase [Bacteroidales bacterium]HCB61718.1 phosphohydrolase [Bacteroidales bacterium]HCY22094.1 phosphohydrolase [Bacteroidales bacterium]
MAVNKRKILNDPVHGFITIPDELIFGLMNHPCFQRLTRIRQLGLTYLVYPGALHTRFNHAIGAMHLMDEAIEILKQKGFEITPDEKQAALVAILLHDVGHGPFSHALEHSLIHNVSHEDISLKLMEKLDADMNGQLRMAIRIFKGTYKKKFLHQLVSSQLDVDRLDYLSRDSFFTGVSEGVVGTERILKMMTIAGDDLAVEEKGIYSVERFIISRRLMYWQVYFHKTVVAAEQMLIGVLKRAHELALNGVKVFAPPALAFFLENNNNRTNLNASTLDNFIDIDDSDVLSSLKVWQHHNDPVLSRLSANLLSRRLLRVVIDSKPISKKNEDELLKKISGTYNISKDEARYFLSYGEIENNAYAPGIDKIWIAYKDGTRKDVAEASDQLSQGAISKTVVKYFLCYPKEIM